MAGWIYGILDALGESGILNAVGILLVVFFGLGYFKPAFRPTAPALMTSLGIFGTFCGIFMALYEFEPEMGNMSAGIEKFLGAMKTAFVTSLLGLFGSILFRSLEPRFPIDTEAEDFIPPEQREVLQRLDAIKLAIAGEGDSSMVTQVQKLRDENRDGFKKLDGLAETIRDSLIKNLESLIVDIEDIIAKQLGESLRNLITNIEEALIRQFGATFVQFNEATQALKKWQEDHREQVEQLTEAFNLAARNIGEIAEDCRSIPPTMEQLRAIMQTAHRDVESLNRQIEAFAGMRRQAVESFPIIKKHLDEIGENLSNSAQGFSTMDATLRGVFQSAEQETRRIAQNHLENVQRIAEGMSKTLESAQRESADQVAEIVASGIRKFDDGISKELERVARAWGGNLVSIAERCSQAIREVDGASR